MMEQHTFVDRFFHSSHGLTDFTKMGGRNINTLFSFLNNLHSFQQDRTRIQFGVSIAHHPEFKLLRIIRNYFHHVGDVDEFRVFNAQNEFSVSHTEMIIIPVSVIAKALINAKKRRDGLKEVESIFGSIDGLAYISEQDCFMAHGRYLIHKGRKHYPGLDLFKYIYNITNIIADVCRETPEFSLKKCVLSLDSTYTSDNNIGKFNLHCHAGNVQSLSTEGYIFPSQK
ncbi:MULTISPECIES: hypothetical protein [Pantoea]|uniref:hypothetical protein n=1 Tax=Pantoea TaxID=53335 RepID=UPI00289328FF|nr:MULTISPECIES: hypothetical protein [Pantoea]